MGMGTRRKNFTNLETPSRGEAPAPPSRFATRRCRFHVIVSFMARRGLSVEPVENSRHASGPSTAAAPTENTRPPDDAGWWYLCIRTPSECARKVSLHDFQVKRIASHLKVPSSSKKDLRKQKVKAVHLCVCTALILSCNKGIKRRS